MFMYFYDATIQTPLRKYAKTPLPLSSLQYATAAMVIKMGEIVSVQSQGAKISAKIGV